MAGFFVFVHPNMTCGLSNATSVLAPYPRIQPSIQSFCPHSIIYLFLPCRSKAYYLWRLSGADIIFQAVRLKQTRKSRDSGCSSNDR
jgi:hypothetical protein